MLEPETIISSNLLEFAGVDPVQVRAIAVEQHVAEKLHAYTRTYADDTPRSRVKDLVDLAVIANTTTLDAVRLARAIGEIFARRATHPVPAAVPSPPSDWDAGWRSLATNVPADDGVRSGHATVALLLAPILSRRTTSGTWDPHLRIWRQP